MLHNWIRTPSLGGGLGFIGHDLGGFSQPSIYDTATKDLAILSDSHGEDDLFSRFIAGPLLTFYHLLSQRTRVIIP